MAVRVPTWEDYNEFDGAHCRAIWERLGADRLALPVVRPDEV